MMMFLLSLQQREATLRALVLGDIHYDPLYVETSSPDNCRMAGSHPAAPYGRYGCDSPKSLVDLTMDTTGKMHVDNPFDAVLHLGDLPAHGLKDIHTPIKYLTQELSQRYPGAKHAFVVGNNEGNGNYNFSYTLDDPYLAKLYDEDEIGLLVGNETFKRGGYYSTELADGLILIGLNTVFLTQTCYNKYHNGHPINVDPCNQFAWLTKELKTAQDNGKQVIILLHASLGVNGFNGQVNTLDIYTTSYKDVTADYGNTIIAEIIGHYHQDQFRFHTHGRTAKLAGFICPSISMSNGNNPGFRILELEKNSSIWRLADYEQYYLDANQANTNASKGLEVQFQKQYRFSALYKRYVDDLGSPEPTVRNLQRLNYAMHQDQQLYSIWSSHSSMLYKPDRTAYLCTITSATADEYTACLEGQFADFSNSQ